jgi:hypothetical protein
MRLTSLRRTLSPIGKRSDGSLVWPVFGAEPDEGGDGGGDGGDGANGGGGTDDDAEPEGQDGSLGDAGKAAVERERKSAERLRKRLKPFSDLSRETGLSIEEMRQRLIGGGTGGNSNSGQGDGGNQQQQVDVDAIRREERLKERERYEKGIRTSAVEAVAATILEDPDDAARYLNLSSYDVDDDGKVDKRQIRSDLEQLIKNRPYLAKAKKAPDYEGGPRGNSAPKGGMSDFVRRQAGIIR